MIVKFTADQVRNAIVRAAFGRAGIERVQEVHFRQHCEIILIGADAEECMFSVELTDPPMLIRLSPIAP